MKTVKFELKRAFHSRSFFASLLIGMVICALDLITFCIQFGVSDTKCLLQAWIGTDYPFAYNYMFYILLPILASLPYGGSLYDDVRLGYYKNICVKTSRMSYVLSKCVATFFSAFVSVVLPLAMNLFVVAGLFPNYTPERLEFLSIRVLDIHLFAEINSMRPELYCLLYILIDGAFAGAIALTSLSIAKLARSRFTAIVAPMILYITSSMLLEGKTNGNWGLMGMLNPRQYVTTWWYQMLLMYLIILVVNIYTIWISTRKRDIL